MNAVAVRVSQNGHTAGELGKRMKRIKKLSYAFCLLAYSYLVGAY